MTEKAGWRMAAVVLVLGLAAASPSWAARRIVLPRPGNVGVEVQGGYGTLLNNGELGKDFGRGPSLAVRLRYRMRYERAIGLSFENDRFAIREFEPFDPNGPAPPDPNALAGRTRINVVFSGIEFYQMFGTRTTTTKMVMLGAGLVQVSGRTLDRQTIYPGDGSYLGAGFGVERFFFRSWAVDLSVRYMAMFRPDDRTHNLQAALGLMFYVGS